MIFFWSYIDSFGRPGVRHRVQDLHHFRPGDSVWGVYQLGTGSDLLDWGDDGLTNAVSCFRVRGAK